MAESWLDFDLDDDEDDVDDEEDEQLDAMAFMRIAGSKSLTSRSVDLLAFWPIFVSNRRVVTWLGCLLKLLCDHESCFCKRSLIGFTSLVNEVFSESELVSNKRENQRFR